MKPGIPQVLVVTSAASGEGKSLTAINLSLMLSRSMEGRVLLVDGDLRRPLVHECLGVKPAEGFGDLLLHPDNNVDRYISRFEQLFVICGGGQATNPASVLASRRTQEIFTRLREKFQFIIVDTPPIVPVVDTHILAGLADGVVVVVRARKTPRELFRRAIESLATPKMLGLVLNDFQLGDTGYSYAYRYQQRPHMQAH